MASGFSYGDQLSSTDLPKKKILLPIDEKGEPNYIYMESYMKSLEYEKLNTYLKYKNENVTEWKPNQQNILQAFWDKC